MSKEILHKLVLSHARVPRHLVEKSLEKTLSRIHHCCTHAANGLFLGERHINLRECECASE